MAMSEYYSNDTGPAEDDYDDEENQGANKNNRVPFHGNDKTMNMNQLILANVVNSPYFKTSLWTMKTFHEVIDEIYYKVDHLEPWERGTRKTAGMSQTGMCGGVRGVSAGGVVSSAFCLLFKVHTLRLSKKQMYAMLNHCDSPYIRGLGFMYLRFTLPPGEILKWFEPYLEDEEMIDIKAGGGKSMTMGEFCRLLLTKMEWFETRFPRIAVIAEKQIREMLDDRFRKSRGMESGGRDSSSRDHGSSARDSSARDSAARSSAHRDGSKSRSARSRSRSRDKPKHKKKSRSRSKHKKRSRSRERKRSRDRRRSRSRDKRSRSHSRSKKSKKEKKSKKSRSRSRERKRSGEREASFSDQLRKYKDMKKSRRSRSRS